MFFDKLSATLSAARHPPGQTGGDDPAAISVQVCYLSIAFGLAPQMRLSYHVARSDRIGGKVDDPRL
jgi:hypothetical protein